MILSAVLGILCMLNFTELIFLLMVIYRKYMLLLTSYSHEKIILV
jgi:hypothetical protein